MSEASDFDIVLNGLKETHNKGSREDQYRILTNLPPNWTVRKVMKEFNCGQNKARLVKAMQKEKGFLATPNKIIGKSLSPETVQCVSSFYQLLPGKVRCQLK